MEPYLLVNESKWKPLMWSNVQEDTFYTGVFNLTVIIRMRWAGHVVPMGEGRGVYRVWWGNLRERGRWGDPGVDGSVILRWIFKNWDVGVRNGLGWLRIGTGGGRLRVR
jgi:hypothetical protein